MSEITAELYETKYEQAWDKFVMKESINGTFLQTRNFLNYHPEGRFVDSSVLFLKGTSIVAVLPANTVCAKDGKWLYSHMGATYGGIIISRDNYNIADLRAVMQALDGFLTRNGYDGIELKMTGEIYSQTPPELLDYFLFLYGYSPDYELGYCVNLSRSEEELTESFTASRRRNYRKALTKDLRFKQLLSDEEIKDFYGVLCDNYLKFGVSPVHTCEELLNFKNNRLSSTVSFYGVIYQNELIAASMVFAFEKNVFHTQYLCSLQSVAPSVYANAYMYKNLIDEAKNLGFKYLSFGTSTLEHGKVLNESLAQFKEGFGTYPYINKTYRKKLGGEIK